MTLREGDTDSMAFGMPGGSANKCRSFVTIRLWNRSVLGMAVGVGASRTRYTHAQKLCKRILRYLQRR